MRSNLVDFVHEIPIQERINHFLFHKYCQEKAANMAISLAVLGNSFLKMNFNEIFDFPDWVNSLSIYQTNYHCVECKDVYRISFNPENKVNDVPLEPPINLAFSIFHLSSGYCSKSCGEKYYQRYVERQSTLPFSQNDGSICF